MKSPIFRRKGSNQAVRYFRRSHRASRKPPAVRAAQSRKSGIWDRISACLYREERSVKIGLVLSPSSHWADPYKHDDEPSDDFEDDSDEE